MIENERARANRSDQRDRRGHASEESKVRAIKRGEARSSKRKTGGKNQKDGKSDCAGWICGMQMVVGQLRDAGGWKALVNSRSGSRRFVAF
jgi:hypothetical protein